MAFKEKRREERYNVEIPCVVGENEDVMYTRNISLHGVGIRGSLELYENTPVDIQVVVDGNPIPLRGLVVHSHNKNDEMIYGLEIIRTPEEWINLIYEHKKLNR